MSGPRAKFDPAVAGGKRCDLAGRRFPRWRRRDVEVEIAKVLRSRR